MKQLHLTFARYGACAVEWEGHVYVFGGNGRKGMLGMRPGDVRSLDNVEKIQLRTKDVVPLLWGLSARRYHGAAVVDGYAYIVGGEGQGGTLLERVDMRTGKV